MSNVQFDDRVIVRCIGNGEGTPAPIAQDEFEVLSGQKLKSLALWELEVESHDIMGELFPPLDTTRKDTRRDPILLINLRYTTVQITTRHRLT